MIFFFFLFSLEAYSDVYLRCETFPNIGTIKGSLKGTISMKSGFKGTILRVRSNSVRESNKEIMTPTKGRMLIYSKV